MLLNKRGLWLLTAIQRQTLEAEAGEKSKKVLFDFWTHWEKVGGSLSQSSTRPRQNPAILSKSKTKGSAQSSSPILKYHSLEPNVATKYSSRWLSLFPAAVQLQAPSWKLPVELVPPLPVWQRLQRPIFLGQRAHKYADTCSTRLARNRETASSRNGSRAPWRGQARVASECRSWAVNDEQERDFFVPLGLY